mgnify:CR=1 FL=1
MSWVKDDKVICVKEIEEELTDISDLRPLAVEFLDNGGGIDEEACNYCQGSKISAR